MIHTELEWHDLHTTVGLGCFQPVDGSVAEFHAMVKIDAVYASAEEQYQWLAETVQRLAKLPELRGATLVRKHFFVSDAINHAPYLTASADEAVSIVQQPPLNGSKASLWLYFVENVQIFKDSEGATVVQRPHYTHFFHTQLHERSTGGERFLSPGERSDVMAGSPLMPLPLSIENQTRRIFDRYSQSLSRHGGTLGQNCLRTWIFVQDVDVQYAGMVEARRDYFEREGLTPQTHYIASTGIEGRYIYPDVLALMDAYAVTGIHPEQIRYLKAPAYLNPTYEYGVTFERGAAVDYGDRRHIFISGTASINNRGRIEHPLDVEKQTVRTFDNVQALLAEADAGMTDVANMIVYLRDTADYAVVKRYIGANYPYIPYMLVLAPVCRPGWLVEVECMAIKTVDMIANKRFKRF